MRLALRLGRTLSELRHSLSASEAMMWMEFDRISPLGDERGDIRNAQIVKAVFGAQGMNVALKDAMLCWGEDEDEDKPEVDPFAALEDALSFAAQS
ncbi:phage tail assembly protein T [Escherichia coli]